MTIIKDEMLGRDFFVLGRPDISYDVEGFLSPGKVFHKKFVRVWIVFDFVVGAQYIKKLSSNFTMTRIPIILSLSLLRSQNPLTFLLNFIQFRDVLLTLYLFIPFI